MEIEQDYNNSSNNYFKIEPNSNINNNYYNENKLFNNINYYNFPFIRKNKYSKKRNYNDSLNTCEKLLIRENDLKFLLNIANKIKAKLEHNITFQEKTKELKEVNNDDKDIKFDNSKIDFKLDYSLLDLNEIIFQLYQSNNISIELKKFVLKKLVDNAIKVERTFQNYFNMNNMPNKK